LVDRLTPTATVRSHEGEGEMASLQPSIGEVRQAWIGEATKLKLIEGPRDIAELRGPKKVLGETYTKLTPGRSAAELQLGFERNPSVDGGKDGGRTPSPVLRHEGVRLVAYRESGFRLEGQPKNAGPQCGSQTENAPKRNSRPAIRSSPG
jgi:hypothetical protein